jgi:phosphatidylglycerol:prolipoprotein diacylglycerol transferase
VRPVIFEIGPLAIRSYGLMLAIAFVIGILLSIYRGKKVGISSDAIMDLALIIIVSAIVGSRLFYILYHIKEFMQSPLSMFSIWKGGLTMYGGFIFAIVASLIFTRMKKLNFWKVADVLTPSIALGLAVTRIGCFFNGCCFGIPTETALGVHFPPHSEAATVFFGQAIHPTQLYSALAGFLIFVVLLLADRYKKFDGFLLALLLILYAPFRFWVESIRYHDTSVMFLDKYSMNQVISVLLFIFGIGMMIVLSRKKESAEENA